jgi:hypothetical protein
MDGTNSLILGVPEPVTVFANVPSAEQIYSPINGEPEPVTELPPNAPLADDVNSPNDGDPDDETP